MAICTIQEAKGYTKMNHRVDDSTGFLRGKRILITSFSLANFGGAELNAVELAEQLVEFGASPVFFSYDIDGPLADFIYKKFNTRPVTDDVKLLAESEDDLGYTALNIEDYDYIWVAANIVPISILKQINTAIKIPKFIFIHMSQLVGFPLDAPLMPDFEKKIASKILSISPKTTSECIYRTLGDDVSVDMWPNPVPKKFKSIPSRSGTLKKVAVISSSHPTEEILKLGDLLHSRGVEVEYIGRFNNNIKVVDADFYNNYDLIVGIGKNATYSLVAAVPIFIYGRFGGGGYITEENFKINEENNFSGRGFTAKTVEAISEEIVTKYGEALNFHNKNRDKFIDKYSIDKVAERIFIEINKSESKNISFSRETINLFVSMQINFMQNIKRFGGMRSLEPRIEYLEGVEDELQDIYNSKLWRVINLIRSILHWLRHPRFNSKV